MSSAHPTKIAATNETNKSNPLSFCLLPLGSSVSVAPPQGGSPCDGAPSREAASRLVTSLCLLPRQSPQVGEPFRQSPAEGNPPAVLAHHGAGSSA
ncbi:hypothetical protein ACF3DV_15775 [Chlorogloeopsis fritschii PCC 9212]|uniref:hypothetical protein n=1 Tax=Chlorogloeopsis fritschii TaxID=1124 RepID=UPI00138B1550|nr:hypothetical protein [Chlorogloeopsis fritschii]